MLTRVDPFVVHFTASDPAPGSGLAQVVATLDGAAVVDAAGWTTTRSVPYELVATAASLRAEILELLARGEIRRDGTATTLLAKLDEADRSRDRVAKLNRLEALLHELSALGGKQAISARAASALEADVRFVLGSLR